MKRSIMSLGLAAAVVLAPAVQAAAQKDYVYQARPGVHEVKYFHGCYDNDDVAKRQRVIVVMNGLASSDVDIESRPMETGKPSSGMFTLRVKGLDASIKLQFRSNDGPHCQQGVHGIAFTDKVVHALSQPGIKP